MQLRDVDELVLNVLLPLLRVVLILLSFGRTLTQQGILILLPGGVSVLLARTKHSVLHVL